MVDCLYNCLYILQIVSGDIYEEGLQFATSVAGRPFKHLILSRKEVPDKDNVDALVQG